MSKSVNCYLAFSEFAAVAGNITRQNIYKLVSAGKLCETTRNNKSGKPEKVLDIYDPVNRFYLEQKGIDVEKVNIKKTPEVKIKIKQKKTRIKKEPVKKASEEFLVSDFTDKKKPDNKKQKKTLAQQKLEIEIEKLKEGRDKLKLDNMEKRSELVRRDGLSDVCFGFLDALLKNIMSMPKSVIDDLEAAMQCKKTRSECLNILTLPICEAIKETKEEMQKEIIKAKKEALKIKEAESAEDET